MSSEIAYGKGFNIKNTNLPFEHALVGEEGLLVIIPAGGWLGPEKRCKGNGSVSIE